MKRLLLAIVLVAAAALGGLAWLGSNSPPSGTSTISAPPLLEGPSRAIERVLRPPPPTPTPEWPKTVRGRVGDAYSASPVMSATVQAGLTLTTTDGAGGFVLTGVLRGTRLVVSKVGYDAYTQTVTSDSVVVSLRPNTLAGSVVDAESGEPVPGARVLMSEEMVSTGVSGTYSLANVPAGTRLKVLAAGYARAEVAVAPSTTLTVSLQPLAVKGLYMSFYTTGWAERREALYDLIDRTELNAVVMDVKGDRGFVSYKSRVPLAQEVGAVDVQVEDMPALVARLKARGIYTIARIVVFKDNVLAQAHPEWAVKDSATGGLFEDWEQLRWADPFRKEVWDYNIAIAEECARMGFDEVQFDYVRFPSEGGVGEAVYSEESTQESRLAAISGFVAEASRRLKPLGVYVAADTFGWTAFRQDDMGIGQRIEDLAPYLDYISPMVYPSTWEPGSWDIKDPVLQPYDIVQQSLAYAKQRLASVKTVRLRPWLQAFDDYHGRGIRYGPQEVRIQKKAAADAGVVGWMLWNAAAEYDERALDPP